MINESKAMQRALELSELGLGLTAPNPIVGAVIVDDFGKVIGEGFHQRANGGLHAEVNAIKAAGAKANGATLVLTLEPCSHIGKTPPCTEAIIEAGIKRVIFALSDPNPIAQGGAARLRSAGIEVASGILSDEVRFSNRAWLTKIEKQRPYITLKVAASLDGRVAAADGSSKWITNESSRFDVAQLRSECDAIITGTGTIFADDPLLTVRGVTRANSLFTPTRIILGNRSIPSGARALDSSSPTIHIQSNELSQLIEEANSHGWNRLLIEAGPKLTNSFIKAGLFDELFLYQAPILLGGGYGFTSELGIRNIADRLELELHSLKTFGEEQRDLRLHLLAVKS